MTVTVSAFYKFAHVCDCEALRAVLVGQCQTSAIKGTILIAPEGINGTIAGTLAAIDGIEAWLRADPRFADLETKRSQASSEPFQRLKVKIKPEIVTFGVLNTNPIEGTGTYVEAQDWNTLIRDPDVTVIDTRNTYEVKVGSFPGALDPGTAAFNDFPDFVSQSLDPGRHRKVAMFCTGGIRCEKASAYMLSQGFAEVYHLKGGILKYLETVPSGESLWQGECFVFDERVALQHGLTEGMHRLCETCGSPIIPDDADGASSEQGRIASPLCETCASQR